MLKTGLRNETTKKLNKIINHMREQAELALVADFWFLLLDYG